MTRPGVWASLDPFVETGAIMGRRTANTGFLRALLDRDPFEGYHFFPAEESRLRDLSAFLHREYPGLDKKIRLAHRLDLPQALAQGGHYVFHLSDCINHPASLARLRNLLAPDIFPITAPTHSLSRSDYARDFLAHLWPGHTPRDVITATSRAGAEAVRRFHAGLIEDYGLDPHRFAPPRVEVIPLGVDTDFLTPAPPGRRTALRDALGFGQECVILCLARLSRHSKMDLLPLERILERMIRLGTDPAGLRFVLAGWSEGEEEFALLIQCLLERRGAAAEVRLNIGEDAKRDLLQAADILFSPSDNPQETFGLTLAEAGACGLPVVASDYDGYRDIVAHGQTGFLVPTLACADTTLIDALAPLLYDNQYHLLLGQTTAVSVPQSAAILATLAQNPDLRARLGAAGRQRALSRFAWPTIIQAHLDLWASLRDVPVDPAPLRTLTHPARTRYGRTFAHYPAGLLGSPDQKLILRQSSAGSDVYHKRVPQAVYPGLSPFLDQETLRRALFLARSPIEADTLATRLAASAPGLTQDTAWAVLAYAIKHDLLERTAPADA